MVDKSKPNYGIEVGDTVRVIDATVAGNTSLKNGQELVITRVDPHIRDSAFYDRDVVWACNDAMFVRAVEIVKKGDTSAAFGNVIASVTTKHIVTGSVYTKDSGARFDIKPMTTKSVVLKTGSPYDGQRLTAKDLREVADLFNELASILEGK